MKIYIDVSNLMTVNFVTGIQRVVREVVLRLLQKDELRIVLLKYDPHVREFYILDNSRFYAFFQNQEGNRKKIQTAIMQRVNEMEPDATFFEIDSVWNSPYRRSALLPEIKRRGLKIASYIYDTIPIIHPQYCHTNTLYKFMDYFGAVIQYADEIIVSTQSVLDSVYEIMARLGLKQIPGYVSWLGSDFAKKIEQAELDECVEQFVKNGKKYVLAVGTIEPRKNHKILLDAFEKGLFDEDVCLVFVGRIGWNVADLEKRIRNHEYLNTKFFYFEGLDDFNVDYLYRNAYLVAFPTYDEGFGLPMIEAFERGIPVIASNCKVLREVGGENAIYFNPDSPEELVAQIEDVLNSPEKYKELKTRVEQFVPFTWDETTDRIQHALQKLDGAETPVQKLPEQLVVLSARCDDICNSLPFVEAYMPFLKRMLLCCPDKMREEFLEMYSGRLDVTILTDDMLLNGKALPEDHQARNFFLRSLMMRRDELDDVFIMSDDDYRPLQNIAMETFVKDDCYQAYYCHSLATWKGTAGKMTSYDLGMFRTLEFLEEYHYPVLQYSSHMPQIIDKIKYQEFLDMHPGVELLGIDEWSGYFNWLQWKYPKMVQTRPYVTMCWPGSPTDWDVEVEQEEYLFENYYEILYEKGKIFNGFARDFVNTTVDENEKKKLLCKERQKCFDKYNRIFRKYQETYLRQYREWPSYVVTIDDKMNFSVPEYIVLPVNGFVRIPAALYTEDIRQDETVKISYRYERSGLRLYEHTNTVEMPLAEGDFEIPLFSHTNSSGKMQLIWTVRCGDKVIEQSMTAFLVSTEGFLKATEVQ